MDHAEQYTSDFFSHNIERWSRWLAELRDWPGVRALEIGSLEGRSAVWLLRNILTGDGSTIDCCDLCESPWIDRFKANIVPWRNRVRLHCGRSSDTLRRLDVASYDIVYIDADHSPYGVLSDAVLAWPLLKEGGIMIFDDYLWLPPALAPDRGTGIGWSVEAAVQIIAQHPAQATKTGVDGFLKAITGHYEVIEECYQMAIRKTEEPRRPG